MKFFAPDNEVPAGSSAPASAVIDAPDASLSVEDFEPASAEDVASTIEGKPVPQKPEVKEPEVKKEPEKKAPEKKEPDPKKPDATLPEKKTVPPAQLLRDELETKKTELQKSSARIAELEKQVAEHPEVKSLREKLTAAEAKEQEIIKDRDEVNRKLALHNPAALRAVRELDIKFSNEILPQMELIPGLTGKPGEERYRQLVAEFETLPFGQDGFKEAITTFRDKLKTEFEDDSSHVLDLLKKGMNHRREAAALTTKLHSDAHSMEFQRITSEWDAKASDFDEVAKNHLHVDPEVAKADPFHPLVYINNQLEQGGEELKTHHMKGRALIKAGLVGIKPDRDEDYVGLNANQIQAKRAEKMQVHAGQVEKIAQLAEIGWMACSTNRQMLEELSKMRERLAKYEGAEPPDPTKIPGAETKNSDTLELESLTLDSPTAASFQ